MATKTDMTEHHICDLCGAEMGQDELVTLYRTDNKLSGARLAAVARLGSQPGRNNVDICPGCRKRPVSDVLAVMYPAQL
jgi:hypothetical protein